MDNHANAMQKSTAASAPGAEIGRQPDTVAGPKSPVLSAGGNTDIDGYFVTFRIAERRFAFPLSRVERIVRMVALIPVPEAPEWISGLINLNGHVLPVISLRSRLGLHAAKVHLDDRILVMKTRGRRWGLIAEVVEDVMAVAPNQLDPPAGSLAQSPLLRAVFRHNDDVYLVLAASQIDPEISNAVRTQTDTIDV